MGIQRNEIRGDTPLDIKHINDNFTTLWYDVYGNSKYAQKIEKALNALTYNFNRQTIGGTNLIDNSEAEVTSANEYIGISIYDILEANPGKELTFSFDMKAAIAGTVTVYALGKYMIGSRGFDVTTAYQRFSFTFTPTVQTPADTWCNWSFYGVYGSGRIPTVRRLKVELGNVATDWNQSESELYSGIVSIDADGINVGISTSNINSQMAYDGFRVFNGTAELASFGEAGAVVPSLQATTITGNVLNTLDSSVTLTVGSGNPYSTVTAALASLGSKKILNGANITINVYGSINDNIDIRGFMGSGSILVYLQNSATINGVVRIRDNYCRMWVGSGGTGRGVVKRTDSSAVAPVIIQNSQFVELYALNLDCNGGSYGVYHTEGGRSAINSCDVVNATQGIWANYGALVTSVNNKGNVSDTGIYSLNGAVVFAVGTIPNGASNGTFKSNGHIIIEGTLTETDSSYSPPSATPTVFVGTFSPTSLYTVNHDTSSVDSYYGATAAQGKYTGMSYWKDGVMTFNGDIYNYWQGGYNVTVEMRVRRRSAAHGTSAGVVPMAYNFSPSEAFNAIACGVWSEWTTVPASVFGSSGATLKFYNPNLNSGYAIFDAAEVKVTVTKDV